MNTTLYTTKDRLRGIRAGQRHMGGEQYRRELRAALQELRQRLGKDHNGASRVKVVITPSAACRISGTLFQRLRSFYTVFISCGLV
jgi:hypothetical protein